MQIILFVIPSLDYGGAARQLTLIAEGLPRDRFRARVCVLGGAAPWAEDLRAAGVEVDLLGWKRAFEPAPFLALRRLLAEARPDVVHLWGRTALRAAAAVGGVRRGCRLFVSAAVAPGRRSAALPDRWLLRRADVVVAFGEAEAEHCRRLGVRPGRVAVVIPGVRPPALAAAANVPPGRLLFCVGPAEPHKGFRDAIWALDTLYYLYNDLRMVLAGDGPDRPRLEQFTRSVEVEGRVTFAGRMADVAPWRRVAELAWVPSRTGGGVNAALEAMAAGLPVIATRLPSLAEIVVEGVGRLVPPGDKIELARQTRFLLNDPERRRAYGEAGRRRAAEHFSVERLVGRLAELYEKGSAG